MTYDDLAAAYDRLAKEHANLAELLGKRKDPEHAEGNSVLARAENVHADACRRAAKALRDRGRPPRNPITTKQRKP